jgi:hypothetical protein
VSAENTATYDYISIADTPKEAVGVKDPTSTVDTLEDAILAKWGGDGGGILGGHSASPNLQENKGSVDVGAGVKEPTSINDSVSQLKTRDLRSLVDDLTSIVTSYNNRAQSIERSLERLFAQEHDHERRNQERFLELEALNVKPRIERMEDELVHNTRAIVRDSDTLMHTTERVRHIEQGKLEKNPQTEVNSEQTNAISELAGRLWKLEHDSNET